MKISNKVFITILRIGWIIAFALVCSFISDKYFYNVPQYIPIIYGVFFALGCFEFSNLLFGKK